MAKLSNFTVIGAVFFHSPSSSLPRFFSLSPSFSRSFLYFSLPFPIDVPSRTDISNSRLDRGNLEPQTVQDIVTLCIIGERLIQTEVYVPPLGWVHLGEPRALCAQIFPGTHLKPYRSRWAVVRLCGL